MMSRIRSSRRRFLAGLGAVSMAWAGQRRGAAAEAEVKDAGAVLEPIRAAADLPALAGMALRGGRVWAQGAVGVRKRGEGTRVTIEDKFHLGSCTKAMTGHLCGGLMEEGLMGRETTLAEALPELADSMQASYRGLTLDHLLSHRSGFPNESWLKGRRFAEVRRLRGTAQEQRAAYVAKVLGEAPEASPGERYIYSNRNFAVAGHWAERVAGLAWEELMERRVFGPLGIRSGGFGAMGKPGEVAQPWQHRWSGQGWVAVEPGPTADNPAPLGPGGTVHMSLGDWARFVLDHLNGLRRGRGHLRGETYRYLHTPPFGGDYMGGWAAAERGWGGGRVYTHTGSNTMNFAVVWMAPVRDVAVLVVTNQGGEEAEKACDRAAGKLIETYLG